MEYWWIGLKEMKEGGEDWIWVDRSKENEGGREERMEYWWTGLKEMKEGGEDWIWVDRIEVRRIRLNVSVED